MSAPQHERFLSVSTLIAGVALLVSGSYLAYEHRSVEDGLSDQQIADMNGISLAEAEALGAADDTLLFDFVDPQEGEAGSEEEIRQLVEEIGDQISQATKNGKDVVLLVRSNVRRFVGELVRASLPRVAVLSYSEVVAARSVETAAVVKMEA